MYMIECGIRDNIYYILSCFNISSNCTLDYQFSILYDIFTVCKYISYIRTII